MLVLSRNINEVIRIGDDIEIMVVDVRGARVRLGITAPRHITVHREEIYQEIQRELATAQLHEQVAQPFEQGDGPGNER